MRKIPPGGKQFVLLIGLTFGVALAQSDRQIDGQIFIRAKDGSTTKFSLTDVLVIDRATAATLLEKMLADRENALAKVRSEREKAQQALKKFNDETRPRLLRQEQLWKEFESASDVMAREAPNVTETLQKMLDPSVGPREGEALKQIAERTKDQILAASEKMQATKKEIHLSKQQIKNEWANGKQLQQQLDSSSRAEQNARNLSSYAADLKEIPAAAKTTSDADGKFKISAPPDAVLFAFASRDVEGTTESYCWLVSAKDESIMLTNRNTVETSAPENFAAESEPAVQPN